MSTPQPPTMAPPEYRDYSERLIGLGACQILLGCLCGLIAAFLVMTRFLHFGPQAQKGGPAIRLPEVAFCLALAVAFIWLGKGMIAARRWAWTLTVVSSWVWVVFGAIAFINVEFIIGPHVWGYEAGHGKMPAQMVVTFHLITGVLFAFVYIGLPGLFLLSAHHDSVRATCVRRDPRVPWTDRCPMPVLALVVLLALSPHSLLSIASLRFVFPIFGTFIAGWAGALAIALMAVILAGLAWGLYRLRMAAWWGALLLGIAWALNTAITSARGDTAKRYQLEGYSADQMEMFSKMGLQDLTSHWGLWTGVMGGIAWVAYLIAVRRYFLKSATSSAGPAAV